jgi:hypothetical protein
VHALLGVSSARGTGLGRLLQLTVNNSKSTNVILGRFSGHSRSPGAANQPK